MKDYMHKGGFGPQATYNNPIKDKDRDELKWWHLPLAFLAMFIISSIDSIVDIVLSYVMAL